MSQFIEDILSARFPEERIFIFVDEIDSILSLYFPVDDFFALICYCYNQRAINPEYNRNTFAIFGVATPRDLIVDKNRTPSVYGLTAKAVAIKKPQVNADEKFIICVELRFHNKKELSKKNLGDFGPLALSRQQTTRAKSKS